MVSIILFIVAGFLNSIMDVIRYRWDKSYFSNIKKTNLVKFCNPVFSNQRKYKNGNPKEGPAFFGSTTFLVWATDLWHLAKGLMILSMCIGATMYQPIVNAWIDPVFLMIAFTGTFELFFGHLWIKKLSA